MTAMPLSFQKLYIQRKSSFFFFFPKILDFSLLIGFTHDLFWTYRLSLELLVRFSGKTNHPCHLKVTGLRQHILSLLKVKMFTSTEVIPDTFSWVSQRKNLNYTSNCYSLNQPTWIYFVFKEEWRMHRKICLRPKGRSPLCYWL